MLILVIIRHAKSDQRFFGNDFERPLNERGKRDAPIMALRLKEKLPTIDTFLSSPATRAKQTAEAFAAAYGKQPADILFEPSLYHAPADVYFDVIADQPGNFKQIAIFGHNPGISNFVEQLVPDAEFVDMATCAIFAVQADVDSWSDFKTAEKKLLFFDYPKL